MVKGKDGKNKVKKDSWISFFIPIIIALVLSAFLKSTVVATVNVPTGSMLNTIQLNDKLVVNRLAYRGKDNNPERYDIVVFHPPDEMAAGNTKMRYVKRVIGLPGETIEIINGVVYKVENDGSYTKLKDDFVEAEYRSYDNFGPYTVPEGCYFMMGDHRNNSEDARRWHNTYVNKRLIIGKAVFRYFPKAGKLS